MVTTEANAPIRQLLHERPDLHYFYKLSLEYSDGSTGYLTFHSLVTDPAACQSAIYAVCAQLKAERDREVAELSAMAEEDRPYGAALPAGCLVALCFVLSDRLHYVAMQSQKWDLSGRSHHSQLIPDVFDIEYYQDKVRHGEYLRSWLVSL